MMRTTLIYNTRVRRIMVNTEDSYKNVLGMISERVYNDNVPEGEEIAVRIPRRLVFDGYNLCKQVKHSLSTNSVFRYHPSCY